MRVPSKPEQDGAFVADDPGPEPDDLVDLEGRSSSAILAILAVAILLALVSVGWVPIA